MAQPRDQSSRFRSHYNVGQLPALVRAVAHTVARDELLGLTQRQFDDARAGAGHPSAPSARQICTRLDRGWRQVLELAFEQASADRALGQQEGEAAVELQEAEIIHALATVLFGELAHSPDDYARERARRLCADRRRRHGGRLALPTAAQIARSAGSWNAALALVGLEPRELGGPTLAPDRLLDQIERYLQELGALPGKRELARWLAARDEPMPRPPMPWQQCLEALGRRRRAQGLWTPERASRHGPPGRPRKDAPRRRRPPPPARPGPVTREQCERAMRDFLAWLPSSRRPTQRAYREFCRQHPGTPWPSSFARFGGWGAMRDSVLEVVPPTNS